MKITRTEGVQRLSKTQSNGVCQPVPNRAITRIAHTAANCRLRAKEGHRVLCPFGKVRAVLKDPQRFDINVSALVYDVSLVAVLLHLYVKSTGRPNAVLRTTA